MTTPMPVTTTFVDQEHLHDPANGSIGDCWRACIASIIGAPIDQVPHFVRDYPDRDGDTDARWFAESRRWLTANHDVTVLYYPATILESDYAEHRTEMSAYPHILIDGPSPRGDFQHVVVGDAATGAIVHDPHPSRAGLRDITGAFVLVRAATDA